MYKKPIPGKKTNLSQFGLLDIPDLDDGEDEPMDLSDDDIDLEAELAAISGGGGAKKKPRKPAPVAPADLDAMIAASLKDVPSDDEGSGDDDDPDLLNELQELGLDGEEPAPPPRVSRTAPPPPTGVSAESSIVSLLQDRITNYTQAEKAAKESGESSRARRFGRGLKTLNDLLKQAKAGKPVKDEDIPPPVSLGKPASDAASPAADLPPPLVPRRTAPVAPVAPEPVAPSAPEAEEAEETPSQPEPDHPPPPPPRTESQGIDPSKLQGLQMILKRKEEFKAAALSAKHAGDKALALEYLKVVKQFDVVVEAYKSGQDMDLNELPTPEAIAAAFKSEQRTDDQTQNAPEPPPEPVAEAPTLITASSVEEALKQRLAAFQEQEAKAKEQGNTSKARRMGRIVKQYQDAIRMHAAGKPIPVDELPTPIGFAPIPVEGGQPSPPSVASASVSPSKPAPAPRPPAAAARPAASSSKYEKQIALLLLRQKQFKEAALKAKKAGNIEQAKEYLRAAKGFDSMIDAAKGGLMVDFKSLPLPPDRQKQVEHTFDIVSAEDCDPAEDASITVDGEDVLSRLHSQLARQLKLCVANRDHCRAFGQIAEANRYEQLAATVKQDLDVVAVAKSLNQNPPKFHYETKQFSVMQCNTDLNENDLELTIVRGIAYNVPNPREIDTYVKFEFPYPQDAPVSDRTSCIKDTNSPQYDAVFPLAIQRGNRACLRLFKRHAIKCQVYSRGGWFSKDSLLGTVTVKLAPLESQVTIHEAFPLMDGRRPAGGSLEVKVRVRTPIVQQQFENSTHRWLVIDN